MSPVVFVSLALIATLTASPSPAWQDPLTIQSSSISLVPSEPLPLGGYTARNGANFEPGGEELQARVALFNQADTQVALVSLEMLTVPESLVDEVKKRIPESTRLMMVATHTHCAPDSQMLNRRMTFRIPGIAVFNRTWLAWYADQIAKAVNSALQSEKGQPIEFQYRTAKTTYNRGRRENANPDPLVSSLQLQNTTLVHYAAHATLLDETRLQLSGDWPGQIMKTAGHIVLPGAIGDVSPAAEAASNDEKVTKMASGLLESLVKSEATKAPATLAYATQEIILPPPTPHPDFAEANNVNDALASIVVNRFAPPTAELTGLVLGDLLIIGVPGEPTSELGRQIQGKANQAGFKNTWVVSHCNGWLGYILMPEDYDEGGYEATLALHGKEFANNILEATEKLITDLLGVTDRLQSKANVKHHSLQRNDRVLSHCSRFLTPQ